MKPYILPGLVAGMLLTFGCVYLMEDNYFNGCCCFFFSLIMAAISAYKAEVFKGRNNYKR